MIISKGKELASEAYNLGLKDGFYNSELIHTDGSWFEKTVKQREQNEQNKLALDAYTAGLQDGYHNLGESHFNEWWHLEGKKKATRK